jgi:hypothetical protein
MHAEPTHVTRPLHIHDTAIMDAFITLQMIPPKRLYRLNLCRIYLQVKCVSEISNPTGTSILQEIWQGHRPHNSKSAMLWPNQNRPHEKSWAEWRTAIKDAFILVLFLFGMQSKTHRFDRVAYLYKKSCLSRVHRLEASNCQRSKIRKCWRWKQEQMGTRTWFRIFPTKLASMQNPVREILFQQACPTLSMIICQVRVLG